MYWQSLFSDLNFDPGFQPGMEGLLLFRAAGEGLALLPSWICSDQAAAEAAPLPEPATSLFSWQQRALRSGGENEAKKMVSVMLLQQWPAEIHSQGALLLDPNYSQDQLTLATPPASGQPLPTLLDHCLLWQIPPETDLLGRLQRLSAQIRQQVFAEKLRVEWLDDGQKIWITGLCPAEDIAFTRGNWQLLAQEESLPAAPEPLLNAICGSIAETVAHYWGQGFGLDIPETDRAFEVFHGHLYFHQGLISRLQGQIQALSWVRWWQACRQELQALKRQRSYLLETFQVPQRGLLAHCRQLEELYTAFFNHSFRSALLLARGCDYLAQRDLLSTLQKGHTSAYSRLFKELQALRDLAQTILAQSPDTPLEELVYHPAFQEPWQIFIAQFGHRGYHEASPAARRFADQPAQILKRLSLPWQVFHPAPKSSWKSRLFQPLWRFLAGLLEQREHFRSDGLWAIYQVRKQLDPLIAKAVQAGQLAQADDFWLLNLAEVRHLDQGGRIPAEYTQGLQQKWQAQAARQVPVLRRDFQGLDEIPLNPSQPMQALGLAGHQQGRLWCPQTPDETLPPDLNPRNSILQVPQVDPGVFLQLLQSNAVVVGQTSDLNGGASLLRSIGIPALLGFVGEADEPWQTGQSVLLSEGGIKLLDSEAASRPFV